MAVTAILTLKRALDGSLFVTEETFTPVLFYISSDILGIYAR